MRRWLGGLLVAALLTLGLPPAATATSLSAAPTGDANIRVSVPNTNYGAKTPLDLKAAEWAALLRFNSSRDIVVPQGEQVSRVRVQLSSAGGTVASGDKWQLFRTPCGWSETSVTWNTRPDKGALLSEAPISPLPAVVTLEVPDLRYLNLDPGVSGGNTCFWVSSSAPRLTKFHTREAASSVRPQLLVDTEPIVPPTTSTSTTTTLPPPAPELHFGHWRQRIGVDWLTSMQQVQDIYGIDGYWHDYISESESAPLQVSQEQAVAAGRPVFINWKIQGSGTWAQFAAGNRDSVAIPALQEMQSKCAVNQCALTVHHEPEQEVGPAGFTAADYVAMWRHLDDLRDVHAPSIKLIWVMMGFEQHQPLYPSLWPGTESVDLIGHDPYVSGTEDPLRLDDKIVSRSLWFRSNIADLSIVVAEYGCDLNGRGTDAHRATCLNEVRANLQRIKDAGVIEMDFFESEARNSELNDPPSPDGVAYRDLVNS